MGELLHLPFGNIQTLSLAAAGAGAWNAVREGAELGWLSPLGDSSDPVPRPGWRVLGGARSLLVIPEENQLEKQQQDWKSHTGSAGILLLFGGCGFPPVP